MQFTENGFLGGRVIARQPRNGFRSGTDAVMLAAAVPARAGDNVLELGCGGGVATLCLAARISDCNVVGVEVAPELVALANENVRSNSFGHRVRFARADALRLPRDLRKSFDHVFCNPPFHETTGEVSPNPDRARALSDTAGLGNWMSAGLARVGAGGTLTVILRADRLGQALLAAPPHSVCVFPLWPRAREPAKRVILQIRKSSYAPFRLAAGLVLHDEGGAYTPEAEAVLRNAASLALRTPRL